MSASADVPVALAANFAFDRKMTNDEPKAEWWRFNNSFTNIEIQRPADLDGIVSKGHSICACHAHVSRPYTNSAGELRHTAYRHSDNWLPSSTLMLDFDNGDTTPQEIFDDPFVASNAWMSYTTTSHSQEHPRFRLVFCTPKPIMRRENFAKALAALAFRYATVDRCSKDVVKAFAGNKKSNYDRILNGRILAIDTLIALIKEHEQAVAAEDALRKERLAHFGDDNEDISFDEVARMLRFIPPHGDYIDWFRTIASVGSALGSGADTEALLESWSPGYPGEIHLKLKSLGDSPRIGIGFVAARAHAAGWRREEDADRKHLLLAKQATRTLLRR